MSAVTEAELAPLRTLLDAAGPGAVSDYRVKAIAGQLAHVWDTLEGSGQTKMDARKLSRMAGAVWDAPVLSFDIERHAAIMQGGVNAEIQHWQVDLSTRTAQVASFDFRPTGRAALQWDAVPIVTELAALASDGAEDPRLKWSARRTIVTPVIGSILPADDDPQVHEGRARRFWTVWRETLLALGWQEHPSPVRHNTFIRPERDWLDEQWDEHQAEIDAFNEAHSDRFQSMISLGYHDIIAALGKPYSGARPIWAEAPGRLIAYGPPGECWSAARACVRDSRKAFDYAEGVARQSPDEPYQPHAWVVDRASGDVIEVTPDWAEAALDGHPEYSGVLIDLPVAQQAFRQRKVRLGQRSVLGTLLRHGDVLDNLMPLKDVSHDEWHQAIGVAVRAVARRIIEDREQRAELSGIDIRGPW